VKKAGTSQKGETKKRTRRKTPGEKTPKPLYGPSVNWKNAKKYPDPKTTPPGKWAWEFLRRNPKYQRDYKRFIILRDNHTEERVRERMDRFEKLQDLLEKKFKKNKPRTPEQVREVNNRLSKFWARSIFDPAGRWGINEMVDPRKSEPPELVFTDEIFFMLPMRAWPKFKGELFHKDGPFNKDSFCKNVMSLINNRPGVTLVVFDLQKPLKLQIDLAKKSLVEEQKNLAEKIKEIHSYTELYPHYLRLLDGQSCRASYADMAKILFPPHEDGVNKAKHGLKAAKLLRDSDYRYLPLSPGIPPSKNRPK